MLEYILGATSLIGSGIAVWSVYRWAKVRVALAGLEEKYAKTVGSLKKCVAQQAELSRIYKAREEYVKSLEEKLVNQADPTELADLMGKLFSTDSSEDSDDSVSGDKSSAQTSN